MASLVFLFRPRLLRRIGRALEERPEVIPGVGQGTDLVAVTIGTVAEVDGLPEIALRVRVRVSLPG